MAVTTVGLSDPLLERLRASSVARYEEEACGLLIGAAFHSDVRVTRVLPCENEAPIGERQHRFQIDPRAVLNVQRSLRSGDERIVGFYHSHPNGPAEPSRLDLDFIRLWPDTVWLIVSVDAGGQTEVRAWWLDPRDDATVRELNVKAVQPTRRVCS